MTIECNFKNKYWFAGAPWCSKQYDHDVRTVYCICCKFRSKQCGIQQWLSEFTGDSGRLHRIEQALHLQWRTRLQTGYEVGTAVPKHRKRFTDLDDWIWHGYLSQMYKVSAWLNYIHNERTWCIKAPYPMSCLHTSPLQLPPSPTYQYENSCCASDY